MTSFHFRLDRVLDWYRKELKVEEARLAECRDASSRAASALDLVIEERRAVDKQLVASNAVPASDLRALSEYRAYARQEESRLAAALAEYRRAEEEQQLKLQAADRRLRLLDKLRNRRLDEYQRAADKEIEEMASDAFLARWKVQ